MSVLSAPSALLLLLLLLSCTCSAASQRACLLETAFPHLSVPGPFAAPALTRVPLRLHFACDDAGRAVGRGRAVAVVLQGAFTAARAYDALGAALARRGLVVAVPQYAARDFTAILKDVPSLQMHFRRARRNGCATRLPLPSAAVGAR